MKRDNSYLIGNKFAEGNKPNKTTFKKGDKPWNAGVKGLHLSPTTEFKKGQKGIHWMPVGTISERTNHNGTRKFIKIEEPNIWMENARFVWMKNNGNIPKGFLIHHIDMNTLNDDIKNLTLLTRAAHINLHREYINSFKKHNKERAQGKLAL